MLGYLSGGRPDIGWWASQIRAGLKFRKDFAMEQSWERWRAYYRGRFQPNTLPSNLFFKMARTIVPRTYFRNPSVSVMSSRPGTENLIFAQILNRVDNKMIRRMKVKQQAKDIVQNTFFFGTGFGKMGFGAQYAFTPDLLETVKPNRKDGRGSPEYNSFIQDNMPWFSSVHPGNIVVPAGCRNLAEAPWIAELHRRPLDDVRSDPRLKNVAGLTGASMRNRMASELDNSGINRNTRASSSVDTIDLWEIRDKRTQQVIVIAPYKLSDKALYNDEDPLQHRRGIPYYDIVFNPDDEVFWGVPDGQILEPLQREKNEIRTWMMYHRRLSLIKLLYQENMIDENELTKLLNGTPLAAVQVKGNPDQIIKILEMADIPDGLIKMDNIVDADVRDTLGQSRNQLGEFSQASARHTKFEAQVVQAASEIRIDERRDVMADMLVDMAEDLHYIMFDRWGSQELLIDVVGPMGIPFWLSFRPQMLRNGAYEVKVDPDSSVPETRDVRERKAVEVYGLLKTNPLIGPVQLTQYLLRELYGVDMDGMLMLPQGLGTMAQPMNVGQYQQVLQGMSQQVPGLVAPGGPSFNQMLDTAGSGGL